MINWHKVANLLVFKTVRFKKDAVLVTENSDGTTTSMSVAELAALNDLGAADLAKIDGITNGTVAAGKAAVPDANKDIGDFRNLDATNLDAGLSGTAGTVDIFPSTAAKGKIALTAADSAGDTTTTIVNASQAAARTYTIPDAGAAASFVMTEGAQTINGVKTLGSIQNLKASNAITAFATGGQASGTLLTSQVNSITVCATAADSVRLPTSVAGMVVQVSNLGAAFAAVFPISGDLIDALGANVAVKLAVGESIIFTCAVAGSWKSTPQRAIGAFTTGTTQTTFAAGQLTGGGLVTYESTVGTPGSIATRTATQMFDEDPYSRVGGTYRLRVHNNQGTGTLTITAGGGVTLTGTATIVANAWRDYIVTYTSATALVMQNIGAGTT